MADGKTREQTAIDAIATYNWAVTRRAHAMEAVNHRGLKAAVKSEARAAATLFELILGRKPTAAEANQMDVRDAQE